MIIQKNNFLIYIQREKDMFETMTTLAMMPQGGGDGGGSPWSMMIMFGAIIAVMYFLIIRPQQNAKKNIRN
jgi:hypothetical protein